MAAIDLTPYAGRWVALVGDAVAGVGHSPEEAKRLAQHNRPKDRVVLRFVEAPGGELLPLPPLLAELRPFFLKLDAPVYLVGGAVRDALRGVENHDLDFVTAHRAIPLAFSIGDKLHKPAYILDRERDAGRVVLAEENTTLDFTCFRGGSLEADLADRDFTINALALPATAVTTASLIDPFNGLADLAHKRLRLVQPDALSRDPIRTLRAVRQAVSFGFELTDDTKTAVIAAAPLLSTTSVERMRDELVKMLDSAVPHLAIAHLFELELLVELLPEVAALADVAQSPPHHEPVLAHTISVLRWLMAVETAVIDQQPAPHPDLADAAVRLAAYSQPLQTYLNRNIDGGLNGRSLLRLAALCHDIGKKATQTIEADGRIRFLGHDDVGAALAAARLRQLTFSNQVCKQVETAVAHHMRPLLLAQSGKTPSRRAVYRYFQAAYETGLDIALLSLADHLATYNGSGEAAAWQNLLNVVAELFRQYFEEFATTVAPQSLLNGRDLIEALHIPAGPEVGRILRLIQEAQAAGDISTREEALAFAHQSRQ